MDPEHDRQISDHVLRMHRYRTAGEQDGDGKFACLVFFVICIFIRKYHSACGT